MSIDVVPATETAAAAATTATYMDNIISVRKANAKKLAGGYTQTKRIAEICYFSLAVCLWMRNVAIVVLYLLHSSESSSNQLLWSPLMILSAMVLSDFISGVAHWSFDTWGTPETFLFGNFIRSFREHHVNQMAMTKHDFIETNADTTLPLIPLLLIQLYFLGCNSKNNSTFRHNIDNDNAGFHVFFLTFALFIGMTNELHKWAHLPAPHPFARLLMSCRIVLTRKSHRRHHRGSYDRSYCITTGWLNAPLDRVDFWRKAEAVVTALTGAVPRANDRELLGVRHKEETDGEGCNEEFGGL